MELYSYGIIEFYDLFAKIITTTGRRQKRGKVIADETLHAHIRRLFCLTDNNFS